MSRPISIAPELMAPAGDWDCARAAVENGADAVYFGLQDGFNARARAANFGDADLPELMTFLRTRGVKGYLTLNTLIFDDELDEAQRAARLAVAAGVDAVLIQDIGLLRLIHRLCPDLPLHASTQMTLSSAECIAEVESLGVRRVVLPRETSIVQIASIHQQTDIELEAFVHGALCISYSGQCLASLSLGGRSANRGQCAQPCRLPYEVLCDGRVLEGEAAGKRYPFSPHDLAAYDRLPELIAAGVSALKIEGRMKPAEYVASVTRHYRAAIDAACANDNSRELTAPESVAEMATIFSRGFGHGWLDGNDPRALVSGLSSTNRGTLLGAVRHVRGERIVVELAGPVRRGDGLVFEGDRSQDAEQGGRVYEIFQDGRSIEQEVASGMVELAFRFGSIDIKKLHPGQQVWKTDDPQATRELRKTYLSAHPNRCVPLDLTIEASVGSPLRLSVVAATGAACQLESPEPLVEATKHPLSVERLTEQFGRLGKTPYELRHMDAKIDGQPMIPLSVLGALRHEMVRLLDAAATTPPQRSVLEESALASLRAERLAADGTSASGSPSSVAASADLPSAAKRQDSHCHLHVLCRTTEQIEVALACGASSVIVDLQDLDRCADAVRSIRAGSAKAFVATPRIHKPHDSNVFELLAKCRPDGILVRNLAALAHFRRTGLPIVADFSFNAANELSVEWLLSHGAARVTASYDLSRQRLIALAAALPPDSLEVVVHRHMPMFHSEYCLFCATFSRRTSIRDCGRPCRRRNVRLRDRLGVEHLLLADSQCRNTLFHAEAESMPEILPSLIKQGVRHFRVELLAEATAEEVCGVMAPFQTLQSPRAASGSAR